MNFKEKKYFVNRAEVWMMEHGCRSSLYTHLIITMISHLRQSTSSLRLLPPHPPSRSLSSVLLHFRLLLIATRPLLLHLFTTTRNVTSVLVLTVQQLPYQSLFIHLQHYTPSNICTAGPDVLVSD